MNEPTIEQIRAAHERIKPHIHRTPVLTCRAIDKVCGASLFFKCENFQKVGAFKIRGATNALFSLSDDEAACGVATHSSGNHAAALAQAAAWRNAKAYVVMPNNAPAVKVAAVKGYGAEITFCEPNLQAREDGLATVVERTGASFVHPYNDLRIITGQATAGLELIEDAPELDLALAPVGGGGLLSGTALAFAALSPQTTVLAGEPAGADDAFRSLQEGKIIPSVKPQTVADGLLTSLGELTFPIIQRHVREIITVSEEEIIAAMRTIWERMKIIVEPSSAVPLAAVLKKREEVRGKKVGIIISGGNVDLAKLPWAAAELR